MWWNFGGKYCSIFVDTLSKLYSSFGCESEIIFYIDYRFELNFFNLFTSNVYYSLYNSLLHFKKKEKKSARNMFFLSLSSEWPGKFQLVSTRHRRFFFWVQKSISFFLLHSLVVSNAPQIYTQICNIKWRYILKWSHSAAIAQYKPI